MKMTKEIWQVVIVTLKEIASWKCLETFFQFAFQVVYSSLHRVENKLSSRRDNYD